MKPICSFCHVGHHIRLNYPILASKKKTRYQCGSSDNLRTAYPLAPWNKRKQRPRLENEENKSNTSSQVVIVSLFKTSSPPRLHLKKELPITVINDDVYMTSLNTEMSTIVSS